MPRFLYSVTILTLVTLGGLAFITWKLSPEVTVNKVAFLLNLTITATLAFSVVFYNLSRNRKKLFVEPRNLYRKQLRRGFLVAIFLSLTLASRFWGGFSKLNTLLLFLFIIAIEVFISRKNGGQVIK